MNWKQIGTAPEGIARRAGASKVCWMILAWPDGEGGTHTGHGMRVNDKFYSSAIFHCGGPYDGKQNEFREVEVFPTHWMPLLDAPSVENTPDHNSEG